MATQHGTRRRRAGRWTAAAIVAGLAVAVFGVTGGLGPASAADDGLAVADLGAEVTVGFGRGAQEYGWSPVEVAFSPRVPIAGVLELRTDGSLGSSAHQERVEVAAGATKVVHLLVSPGSELQASFRTSDGTSLRLPPAGGRSGAVLVGAIGTAPALPETLTSAGSDREVRGVPVDPALLDLAPRSLDPLDALVVPAAELAALDARTRDALAVATAQGLDLIVPVDVGAGPLGLPWEPLAGTSRGRDGLEVVLEPAPDAWGLTAGDVGVDGDDRVVAAATPAGRGRVVATATPPGRAGLGATPALWSALLQPRADNGPPMVSMQEGGLSQSLFGAAISVPGATGPAVFVIVFLLVVGPVNAFVLKRMGRRELAWVTVPALAAVFTLLAVAGAAQRTPTSVPVVHAAWWVDGVGEQLTAVGVQGAARGTVSVGFPGARDGLVAEPWSGLAGATDRGGDGTVVSVGLETLQAATVIGWAPAPTAPLQASAVFEAGTAEVTLTNVSDAPLADVELHLATVVERVGALGPGEEITVTLDELAAALPGSRWGEGGGRMFPHPADRQAAEPRPEVAVELLRGAVLDDTPGLVWVTATTTDDIGLTAPTVRGSVDDRGTTIAVGVTPGHQGPLVAPHQVHRHILRATHDGWRPGPLVIEGAQELLVRFRLPVTASVDDLVSTLDAGGSFREGHGEMMGDPWAGGCWEVTTTDVDGVTSEPEELCGPDVTCPPGSRECGGSDHQVEACFEDGRCQRAVRVGDDPAVAAPVGSGDLAGVELLDVTTGAFVPASEVIADGRADGRQLVSPLGEVLLRVRGAGLVNVGRRGLGIGGAS